MRTISILSTVVAFALAGCAVESTSGELPPSIADDVLEAAQIITSVVNGQTWTADAKKPEFWQDGFTDYYTLRSSAVFTGPAGATRKMGVCFLQHTTKACNTVADCASTPATLPTGGYRYCTGANGSSSKYCAFRPGSQTDYCAGTPANGGVAIPAGTYSTDWHTVAGVNRYLSYACFEGCTATDPSSSSLTLSPIYCEKNPSSCQ